MQFHIGEIAWVRDDEDESDFYRATVQSVSLKEQTALVTYETDHYYKEREITFEELEKIQDLMFETASWWRKR